jgi:hypothetical protein
MSVLHVAPLKPGAQAQVKAFTPSVHVPPFWQGWLAHSSMFVPQVAPL